MVSISRAVARCKVARLKPSKQQESYAKGGQKSFFSRVSEATLASFSSHSWDVLALGAKQGGVPAFRVVSISRRAVACCKVARLKPSKRQKSYAKGSQKSLFSGVSEATLGSFSGHFWDVLGAKLGGVSAFRVVSISRAVARCKVAKLKPSKQQESYAKGSQFFS